MSFRDKKVAITGAGPGLGRTLAICFARLEAELFLSARTLDKASETAGVVASLVPAARVHSFACDVTKPAEIRAFAGAVSAATSSIDLLINNASSWLTGSLESADDEQLLQTIDSTVSGAILTTKHFLPLLRKSPEPDLINISGTPGLPGDRHDTAHPAFSAAKAALATFADRLRNHERGTGLRVMTVVPPNFENTSPLDERRWNEQRGPGQHAGETLTARNVFECIQFALSQDRRCSIDQIVLSNNSPER